MKDNFEKCLEFVLKWEGGYVNDPNDPGGRTIYGISEKAHPEVWAQGVPTKETAKKIYKEKYWDKIKADELPEGLDLAVFDMAVNAGPNRAIRILQRMLGVYEDGIIGDETMTALKSKYVNTYNEFRKEYYTKLTIKFPKLKRFEKGWNNRIEDLNKTIKEG